MCLSIMLISKLLPDVVFKGFVVKWHGELKGEICSTVIESVFFLLLLFQSELHTI